MISFNPFPVIQTENLLLRKMTPEDASDLFQMRSDPRMHTYTDTKPDENAGETAAYISKMSKGVEDNKWIIWAMEHQETKKVIGSISIWNINEELGCAELGYGIIPDFQGKGLMKEALKAAAAYGFQRMKLKALEAYTEENNTNSARLLESATFIEVNRVQDQGCYSEKVYHMIVYRLENQV